MKAMAYTLREVVERTGVEFGAGGYPSEWRNYLAHGIWNPKEATDNQFTFLTQPGYSNALFTIIHPSLYDKIRGATNILLHPSPRYAAAKVAELWHVPHVPWEPRGLHRVTSYTHVSTGKNFVAGPGVVLGADGFGFEHDPEFGYFKFPHLGGVIIGDDVEIQSLSTVDRGVLSHTRIGNGTKLDSHVHVGHNAQIGNDVMITAGVTIGGSVTIEDGAWLGLNATIMQGVTIGARATIGIGATVLRDVNPDQTVVGIHRVIETKSTQRGVIR